MSDNIGDVLKAVSNSDQTAATMKANAELLASHYQNLIDAGMSEEQAFQLTREFQFMWLRKVWWPDLPPAGIDNDE